jgi:hypothetical protein
MLRSAGKVGFQPTDDMPNGLGNHLRAREVVIEHPARYHNGFAGRSTRYYPAIEGWEEDSAKQQSSD